MNGLTGPGCARARADTIVSAARCAARAEASASLGVSNRAGASMSNCFRASFAVACACITGVGLTDVDSRNPVVAASSSTSREACALCVFLEAPFVRICSGGPGSTCDARCERGREGRRAPRLTRLLASFAHAVLKRSTIHHSEPAILLCRVCTRTGGLVAGGQVRTRTLAQGARCARRPLATRSIMLQCTCSNHVCESL
jgi:hypothetical protein